MKSAFHETRKERSRSRAVEAMVVMQDSNLHSNNPQVGKPFSLLQMKAECNYARDQVVTRQGSVLYFLT
jgi:predicted nuclease of predicted toxin-antitoxin system